MESELLRGCGRFRGRLHLDLVAVVHDLQVGHDTAERAVARLLFLADVHAAQAVASRGASVPESAPARPPEVVPSRPRGVARAVVTGARELCRRRGGGRPRRIAAAGGEAVRPVLDSQDVSAELAVR
jgi:hypothetical protein